MFKVAHWGPTGQPFEVSLKEDRKTEGVSGLAHVHGKPPSPPCYV